MNVESASHYAVITVQVHVSSSALQEAFNARIEIMIRSKKEGVVNVKSGFYTEARMKTELKYDKLLALHSACMSPAVRVSTCKQLRDRIKAVKAYCTADSARKRELTRPASAFIQHIFVNISTPYNRKDKYQSHIREYWVDVETTGCLTTSHAEEVTQSYVVVDDNASLPAPILGSTLKPNLDREAEDDSSSEQAEATTPSPESMKKRKRPQGTPSPRSHPARARAILRKSASKKAKTTQQERENREEVEEVLEVWATWCAVTFLTAKCLHPDPCLATCLTINPACRTSTRFRRCFLNS